MLKYKDPSFSTKERVQDLMSRMTFKQKIDQITCLVTITSEMPDFKALVPGGIGNVGAFTVAENAELIVEYSYRLQKFLVEETPLGIPALIHCEACAGASFTEADVFPSAIAQASTFNPAIVEDMSSLISRQLCAVGFRQALSPVLDITRDPRWGRITETYGEDPTLTASMGSAFIRGLQKEGLSKGVLATAKHFIGHGITEGGLNMGRNLVTERELLEVHCKPFQAAITEEDLGSIMNSYCSINGEPVVGSKKILSDILREEMGFAGFVVSDYIAIDRLVDPFCVAGTFEEAGIRAIEAGVDVEYPRPKGYTYALKKAVAEGRLDMTIIDRAVERVLTAKFDLGLFERPYPDQKKLQGLLHKEESGVLNLQMARESIILLKNDHKLLPLSKKEVKKIAVVGPHGDSVRSYFGTFSYPAVLDMTLSREEDGQVFEEPGLIIYDIKQSYIGQIRECSPRIEKKIHEKFKNTKSLRQALDGYLPDCKVTFAKGINCAGTDMGGMEEALACAAQADIIILTLGGKNGWGVTSTVGEGVDSTEIDLPGQQELFARKIRALNKKTVVLHFDGRPLSNAYVAAHFDAVLEVWQPGEYGGQALCDILFGNYNPAGRLPVTAARNTGQIPVYYSLPRGSGYIGAGHPGMIRNPNGYINDTAFPLFYFGHGLSYTKFEYSNMKVLDRQVNGADHISVSVDVANVGEYDGDEVVQLYYSDEIASMVRPSMELGGFKRIFLKQGDTKRVVFSMKVSQCAFLNDKMDWIVEEGDINLYIGASSNDIRVKDKVYIMNTKIVEPRTRGFYAAAEVYAVNNKAGG